jgi:hypothetical protein
LSYFYYFNRIKAQELTEKLKESLDLLKELKIAIENKHAAFDFECGKVESVTTPKQTVLFLMWVTKNAERLAQVYFIKYIFAYF